jgi:hypothetical protein
MKDATWGQYTLDFIGDSHHPAIALMVKKYEKRKSEAQIEAHRRTQMWLREVANDNLDFMVEKDESGNPTGRFLQEFEARPYEESRELYLELAAARAKGDTKAIRRAYRAFHRHLAKNFHLENTEAYYDMYEQLSDEAFEWRLAINEKIEAIESRYKNEDGDFDFMDFTEADLEEHKRLRSLKRVPRVIERGGRYYTADKQGMALEEISKREYEIYDSIMRYNAAWKQRHKFEIKASYKTAYQKAKARGEEFFEQWFDMNHEYNAWADNWEPTMNWKIVRVRDEYKNAAFTRNRWGKLVPKDNWRTKGFSALNARQRQIYNKTMDMMVEMMDGVNDGFIRAGYMPAVDSGASQTRWEIWTEQQGWYDRQDDPDINEANEELYRLNLKFLQKLNQQPLIEIPENATEEDIKRIEAENERIREENRKAHAAAISYDLRKVIPKFISAVHNYKFRRDMESEVLLMREMIRRSKMLKTGGLSIGNVKLNRLLGMVTGKEEPQKISMQNSVLMKQYEDWLRSVFYERGELNEGRLSKAIRVAMNWMSLKGMGLNWSSGINNKLVGEVQQFIEAAGSGHYSMRDYWWGEKKIHGLFGKRFFQLFYGLQKAEKEGRYEDLDQAILGTFNILQDQSENTSFKGDLKSERIQWYVSTHNAMYFMLRMGEFSMQSSIVMAYLKSKGLYDKLRLENGQLAGMTTEEIADVRNRIIAILEDVHGRYNAEHASAIQKYALARAAFQFKKWAPSFYNKRFGSRSGFLGLGSENYFNERRGETDEGFYVTAGRFAFDILKDMVKLRMGIAMHFHELTPIQQANVRKMLAEMAMFAFFFSLRSLIKWAVDSMDDDDDEPPLALQIALYQSDRLVTELQTLWILGPEGGMFNEAAKMRKNPIPILTAAGDVYDLLRHTVAAPFAAMEVGGLDQSDLKYKGGAYHGQYKALHSLLKLTPIVNQAYRLMMLDSNMRYYKMY